MAQEAGILPPRRALGLEMEAIANFRGSAIMGDAGTTVGIPRFPRGESGTSDRAKRGWFPAQVRDRFHRELRHRAPLHHATVCDLAERDLPDAQVQRYTSHGRPLFHRREWLDVNGAGVHGGFRSEQSRLIPSIARRRRQALLRGTGSYFSRGIRYWGVLERPARYVQVVCKVVCIAQRRMGARVQSARSLDNQQARAHDVASVRRSSLRPTFPTKNAPNSRASSSARCRKASTTSTARSNDASTRSTRVPQS
jgi:hypothetical protein